MSVLARRGLPARTPVRLVLLLSLALVISLFRLGDAHAAPLSGLPLPEPFTTSPRTNGLIRCAPQETVLTDNWRYSNFVGGQDICDALARLEDRAVGEVTTNRGLPANPDLVRLAARDEVTAALFADLVVASRKAPADRSADEQAGVGWLTQMQQRFGIEVAVWALDEYDSWKTERGGKPGPCTYSPPDPFAGEYPEGRTWVGCFSNTTGGIFGQDPPKPSANQFLRWGSARVTGTMTGAQPLATRASAAMVAGVAAASGGLAVAGGLGAGALASTAVFNAMFPFTSALVEFAGLAVGSNATLATAGAAPGAIGAAVGAAVFYFAVAALAVAAIVVKALQIFGPDVRSQLQQAVTSARATTPDLTAVLGDANASGQLFATFVAGLAQQSGTVPVPQRTQDDVTVGVDGGGGQPTFTARGWDGKAYTVEVRSGWFVLTDAAGGKALQTWFPTLDPAGRKLRTSRVLQDGVWRFLSVPAESAAGQCTLSGTCQPTAVLSLLSGTGVIQTVEFRPPTPVGLELRSSVGVPAERQPVTWSYLATRLPDGTTLRDVRWTAVRTVAPWRRGSEGVAYDPCTPLVNIGGLVNVPLSHLTASHPVCSVSGTGSTFPTNFAMTGRWTMTLTAETAAGTQVWKSTTIDVANQTPDVTMAAPCTSADQTGCSRLRVPEGDSVVLVGRVRDSVAERAHLRVEVGTRVRRTAVIPCDQPARLRITTSWGLQDPPICPTGLRSLREDDGSMTFSWTLPGDGEPDLGPVTVSATDDHPTQATGGATSTSGPSASWFNLAPVVTLDDASAQRPLPGATFRLSGTVRDPSLPGQVDPVRRAPVLVDGVAQVSPQLVREGDHLRWTVSLTAPRTFREAFPVEVPFFDNQGLTSSARVLIHPTPPAPVLTAVDTGTGPTAEGVVVVTPTVSLPSGGVVNELRYSVDGGVELQATRLSTTTWRVALPATPEVYAVRFRVVDSFRGISAAVETSLTVPAASAGGALPGPTPTPTPATATVTVTGGDHQSARHSHHFAAPLTVTVTGSDGEPLPGARVRFAVTTGSATFHHHAAAEVTTDASGVATSPSLTAGRHAGPVVVTATHGSAAPAQFQLTVTPQRGG